MLYQNPAIQSRVEVHLVEETKGGPSKLLLSFLYLQAKGTYQLFDFVQRNGWILDYVRLENRGWLS
jgi:hypothetical protein